MTKRIVCMAAAVTVALSATMLTGCGNKSTDDESTITSTETQTTAGANTQTAAEQSEPVLVVFDEYDLMEYYTQYASPDGSFSMQFPEGSTVNDADAENITVNVAGDYDTQDTINISKTSDAQKIESTAQLMEMLSSDSSIDVTAFYVIKKDGEYKGYKYLYDSVDNTDLKGIVSTYFSDDGTAHVINATIYNGGDENDVHTINAIVDTFIG